MIGIDEFLLFQPLNITVLTVSVGEAADDQSGNCLSDHAKSAGHRIAARATVKDGAAAIAKQVKSWADDADIDAILTTGGTGLTGQDVTTDAITPLFDKTLDGFSVIFQRLHLETAGLSAVQSRPCAGIIDGTFVFCLPASAEAVAQVWDEIIAGALDSRYRPSSLVDLIPRLNE